MFHLIVFLLLALVAVRGGFNYRRERAARRDIARRIVRRSGPAPARAAAIVKPERPEPFDSTPKHRRAYFDADGNVYYSVLPQ